MEGEWSCCRGGQFNGEIMVMLQRWCLIEADMVMLQQEVCTNGGRMVMLRRWPV